MLSNLINKSNLPIDQFYFSPEFSLQELVRICEKTDCFLAIERSGPNKDNLYKTMSNKTMKNVAPLE